MRTRSFVPLAMLAFLTVARNATAAIRFAGVVPAGTCHANGDADWWTMVWNTVSGWSWWTKACAVALLLYGLVWLLKTAGGWLWRRWSGDQVELPRPERGMPAAGPTAAERERRPDA